MPLIELKDERRRGVALWHITETEEELTETLKTADSAHPLPGDVRLPLKQRQRLACRLLAATLTGIPPRVTYDGHGKPCLENYRGHISFSHSGSFAAAAAGNAPVGVDVELMDERVGRIAARFLCDAEMEHVPAGENRLPYLHVLWGAKEVLYKVHGRKQLSFSQHLHISPFTLSDTGTVSGRLTTEAGESLFDIRYRKVDGAMLVYISNG